MDDDGPRRPPDAVIIVAVMIAAAVVLALLGPGEPVVVPGRLDTVAGSISGGDGGG